MNQLKVRKLNLPALFLEDTAVKVHCIEFSITLSNYVTWQYTIHQFSDSVPIITMFIHQPLHIQCIFFPKGVLSSRRGSGPHSSRCFLWRRRPKRRQGLLRDSPKKDGLVVSYTSLWLMTWLSQNESPHPKEKLLPFCQVGTEFGESWSTSDRWLLFGESVRPWRSSLVDCYKLGASQRHQGENDHHCF